MWITTQDGQTSTLTIGAYSAHVSKDERWVWSLRDGETVIATGKRRTLASAREAASTRIALLLWDALGQPSGSK